MSGFLLDTNVVSEMTFDAPDPRVIAFLAGQDHLWLPASAIPLDPADLQDIQNATAGRRLIEVTRISVGSQAGTPRLTVDLSIASWRAAFYSRHTSGKPRKKWHRIRGTRPGVSA